MGLFGDKYKQINAEPVFKVTQEEQQLQQQDTMQLLNERQQQNIFRSQNTEPAQPEQQKIKVGGVFSKGEATEIQSPGTLESINREDVESSMLSCVEKDMEELSEDDLSIAILKQIKSYNDPSLDKDVRPEFFLGLKASLDTVYKTHETQLSEKGMTLLEKYYTHFNGLAMGELTMPEQPATLEQHYFTVDGVSHPPIEKDFGARKIIKKDMSDVPLFDHEPTVSDIKQGSVGDCYFLAAIASMVSKDSKSVKEMMRDNGDGTVTVRFHRRTSMGELRRDLYWKDKNFDELPVKEKIAKTFGELKEESVKKNSAKSLVPIFANSRPEACIAMCEKLLALDTWKNKDFISEGDNTPLQTLINELNRLEDADIIKLTMEIQQIFLDFDDELIQNGEISDTSPKDVLEYVTVKKETSVFEGSGRDTYAHDCLWVQLLERAYAASKTSETKGYKGYNALDQGGQSGEALEKLMGKAAVKLFDSSGSLDITTDSSLSLSGALKKELGANAESFSAKLKEQIPSLRDAPESAIKELIRILDKADKKNLRTIKKVTFRSQMAELDDLLPLIVESRLALVEDKRAGARENVEQRALLARELTALLKNSDKSVLSFKPFSGEYSKSAETIYESIQDNLSRGKLVNASTTAFVPKTVTDMKGLNRESMKDGIAETHAYTVLGVKEEQGIKYVTLRNPWGTVIRSYYKTDKGEIIAAENSEAETSGVFHVELNDFVANYDRVTAN